MWSVNVVLPFGIRFRVTSRGLWPVLSGLALLLLLWAYVVVLLQGLERGEQMRAEQRRVANQSPHKAAVRTAQLAPPAAKP